MAWRGRERRHSHKRTVREGGKAEMKQRDIEDGAEMDERSMKCQHWSHHSVTATLVL